MKKIFIVFMLVFTLFSPNCYALSVSSRSMCIMDTDSGRVLYSKDENTPRLIASTTNIMTT